LIYIRSAFDLTTNFAVVTSRTRPDNVYISHCLAPKREDSIFVAHRYKLAVAASCDNHKRPMMQRWHWPVAFPLRRK